MSNPTLSSGALEVVSRINISYETKMNCNGFFKIFLCIVIQNTAITGLNFFVVLNMLICNLNEEHTCPLSEKKVGIVQFPVQFDESHFSLTFQAIINGQNFDKPVLQVIVSYIVLIIFVFIHLNNMQCGFFFKETLDFILLNAYHFKYFVKEYIVSQYF